MKTLRVICGVVLALQGVCAVAGEPVQDRRDAALVDWLDQALSPRAGTLSAPPEGWPVRVQQQGAGQWQVDLGSGMLQEYPAGQIPAELDERLQQIRLQLLLSPRARGGRAGISFRFHGQPLERWFGPEPRVPAYRQLPQVDVVVSASHGRYFHGGFNDWRLQRPQVNGVVEDLLTPQFAARLVPLLQADGLRTLLTRPAVAGQHPRARAPWWEMAARYHAESRHPDRPDIWRSYADRETPLREYNDDIRTRPLLANAHGASALIHLHTNAGGPDASGAMAFVHAQRPQDRRLAHNVLCAVRQAVQAVPQYRDYRVRVQPLEGNYGENRLAMMPSVLLEIGFHTHPGDAAAMRDPVFQQAVAQGVRDGHADFVAGRGEGGAAICQ